MRFQARPVFPIEGSFQHTGYRTLYHSEPYEVYICFRPPRRAVTMGERTTPGVSSAHAVEVNSESRRVYATP